MSDKRKYLNRILFAAPRSGSGKTMLTCGFLNLLKQKSMDVTSYKCGPDYIDPMFHKKVLGIYGGNLDTFFCSHEKVAGILGNCDHEYAVIEGVMGLYDGIGGLSVSGSGYDIATATKTPIILIIDAYGTGRTIISQIKGILADDSEKLIKGIILNKTSEGFFKRLKTAINDELKAGGYEARVLGFLPKLQGVNFDSRHLGLLRPEEIADIQGKIDIISRAIEDNCEVDGILEVMRSAEPLKCFQNGSVHTVTADLTLAVAMDEAFCFYYKENLELLQRLGVKIQPFSPIHDKKLPDDVDGLYIGGGYPELYLKELSDNEAMRSSIKEAIEGGLPSLAECGGFMYLNKSINDEAGVAYEMVGVVDGDCVKKERLVRFGYVQILPGETTGKVRLGLSPEKAVCNDVEITDQVVLKDALDGMKAHEFHYYDSTDNGTDMLAFKAGDDKTWEAMHVGENHVWGFPHLYYESNPLFAEKFVEVMRDGRK